MSMAETSAPDAAAIDSRPTLPLSVILPNFNHGGLIARALKALLDQTPSASEIIVVDDGSTDDSVAVIEGLQRRYPSIRLIRHATNQGIVIAVKTALAVATGEYLLFASSDDYVLPGLFARALAGLSAAPQAAFFCSGVALVDAGDRVIGIRPVTAPQRGRGYLSPAAVRKVIRNSDFWALGTSTVYRRRLLADIGYFDARLGSLGDALANRLLAFQHGFYFDPAVLAAYNKDPMSFSGRSALSVADSQRLLAAAASWIAENLPADVRDEHGPLFDRRMRFAFARLWVIWSNGQIKTDDVADLLNFGRLNRAILTAMTRLPVGARFLTLGWMTLRMRPFGLRAMAEAWWRAFTFRRSGRLAVSREVDKVNGRTVAAHSVLADIRA
jgi:glycosyltransferase involved in cell wall biosynthesis